MADNKTRTMSAKGFLYKTTTKAANSAMGFIQSYRQYLETGELSVSVSPILKRMDTGQLLPTPALKEIQQAVLAHIVELDRQKMEKSLAEQQAPERPSNKPWIAKVLDAQGNICTRVNSNGEVEDLIKDFDDASSADRWCDRRLFEGASDWHAEVDHATLKVHTIILRQDAISRILHKKKGPVVAVRGQSTKTLGFQGKAKQSRCHFSHG